MPGAGHVVHMPSHIYFRVGRHIDSLRANRRAVAGDEGYLVRRNPGGFYATACYPHNVHCELVSAQMAGDFKSAAECYCHAIALQDELAYMEPAYWYYPVRQSLGMALRMQGDTEGAEQAFRGSLNHVPNKNLFR